MLFLVQHSVKDRNTTKDDFHILHPAGSSVNSDCV